MVKDSANNPMWQKIWPAFGASNQLVAALALLVIACWLLRKEKNTLYALIPAGFMLVTSVTALGMQLMEYLAKGEILLSIISVVLIGAAGFLTWEVGTTFTRFRKICPI
jgi:carbon starvation protein